MATTKYDMTHIDAMNGHEFEHFLATLLRKLGYQNVDVTRGSGDQGVDVFAEKEGVRYAVQCKCYSSDLGNTPVQEVNTGKVIYHCHVGVVVTNRHFTQGAKDAAKATGVLLWDRDKLRELITQAELGAQSTSNEDALLKRGFMALEDGEWRRAESFFEKVLNLNAECGDAYLGKVLAAVQVTSLSQLREKTIQLDDYKDFSRAMQFSSGVQLQALQWSDKLLRKKWQMKEEAEFRRKEEEIRAAAEQQKVWQAKLDAEHHRKEEQARIAAEQKEAWIARMAPFWKSLREYKLISAGSYHTVGLKADGTAITTGFNRGLDWKDIISVSASGFHTVGLKADGTVVKIAEYNFDVQKAVSAWRNIIAVDTGADHTAGLKSDGTVVTTRFDLYGQCDEFDWKNIVMVAAEGRHTVGLKSDGTVVIAGTHFKCRGLSSWTDIVAIDTGSDHTVGLKSDGTVVAVGKNRHGECNVSGWKDIVSVAAGGLFTVGLRSDGTVVAVGCNDRGQCDVSDWKNIVAIAAGGSHTVGLKDDGTVVAVGENSSDQCKVSDWKLFDSIETLEQERINSKIEAENLQRQEEEHQRQKAAEQLRAILEKEKSSLQKELASLHGLFSGRRRSEIETRLKEIDNKLIGL